MERVELPKRGRVRLAHTLVGSPSVTLPFGMLAFACGNPMKIEMVATCRAGRNNTCSRCGTFSHAGKPAMYSADS